MEYIQRVTTFLLFLHLNFAFGSNPSYNKTLVPMLPANYTVVSLDEVANYLFEGYRQLISHQLISAHYEGPVRLKNGINTGKSFMLCENSNREKPFGYFCIDHSKWVIRTTVIYKPSTSAVERFTLTFKVKGKSNLDSDKSNQYDININIQPKCPAQATVYEELATSCSPKLKKILYQKRVDNVFKFELPAIYTSNTLKLHSISLKRVSKIGRLNIKVLDENEDLIVENNIDIVRSDTEISVDEKLRKGSKVIKLVLDSNYFRSDGKDVTLAYYVMDYFCGNKECVLKYYHWVWISRYIPKKNKGCVKDWKKLKQAFKDCYDPFTVEVIPSTKISKYGEPLSLKCQPSDILLPYNVHWSRIRRTKTSKPFLSPDNYLRIPSLSYYDHADYRCIIITVGGEYMRRSNEYHVDMSDVFTGELIFELISMPFESEFRYSNSPRYMDVKRKIEKEINQILDNGNPIYPNRPSFNITSFMDRRGHVAVKGDLSMLKSGKLMTWPSLKWVNYFSNIIKSRFTFSSMDNVELLTESTCSPYSELSTCGNNKYKWPSAMVGETLTLPCSCNQSLLVYKKCKGNRRRWYGSWEKTDDEDCRKTMDIQKELQTLSKSKVTSENAADISKRLVEISSMSNMLKTDAICLVTDTLEKFKSLLSASEEVTENVMNSINDVFGATKNVLAKSEEKENTTSRLVKLLGNFGDELATTTPRIVSKSNFALAGLKVIPSAFQGMSLEIVQQDTVQQMKIYPQHSTKQHENAHASLYIPPSVKRKLLNSTDTKVVSVSYWNDNLFVGRRNSSESNFSVNSFILSGEIRGHTIQDLDEPITLTFKATNASIISHEKKCVYWDFADKNWSDKGCRITKTDYVNKLITCSCDHMTNFAILFNAVPPEGIHGDILSYITYVGLGISLLGAVLTLVTYSIFPMLRSSIPPKILMNLCVALIMMKIFFLVGEVASTSKISCKIVSVLLQYFFLAVFTWSAVEGFHSSRGLVFPMKVEINSFMQKAIIFGWGVPIIFTAIGAGVWFEDYGRENRCVVGENSFYYTVLIPITCSVLFNLVCLFAITGVLIISSRSFKSQTMRMSNRVRIIFGFLMLFGITWIFGFFVISNSIKVFHYMYCIFSSMQGFYLFVFYVVRKKQNRYLWWALFQGKSVREIERQFTLDSQNCCHSNADTLRITLGSNSNSGSFYQYKNASVSSKLGLHACNSMSGVSERPGSPCSDVFIDGQRSPVVTERLLNKDNGIPWDSGRI